MPLMRSQSLSCGILVRYPRITRLGYPLDMTVVYSMDVHTISIWKLWPIYFLDSKLCPKNVKSISYCVDVIYFWGMFQLMFFFKIYSYCFLELMERICWSSYYSFKFNEQNKVGKKCKIMSMKKIQPNHIIVRVEGILFKQITRRDYQYLWKAYTHEWLLPVYFTGTGPGSCNEQWNPVNIVNFR